jgi:uncharacterized membrane protein
MHVIARFAKTTVIGGALVLLPVAGCLYLLALVVKSVVAAIKPLNALLPVENLGGVALADFIAIAIVIGACFLLGLLVPTALGQGLGRLLESKFLNLLPGYQVARRVARQLAGSADEKLGAPVLVRLGDSRQLAFLIDETPAGQACVFIPLSPVLSMGNVHVVNVDAIQRLAVPVTKIVNCVTTCGIGSLELLAAESVRTGSDPGDVGAAVRTKCG